MIIYQRNNKGTEIRTLLGPEVEYSIYKNIQGDL